MNYADLPNVDMLHYMISETHSLMSPKNSFKKIFKYWEAVRLTVANIDFQKF